MTTITDQSETGGHQPEATSAAATQPDSFNFFEFHKSCLVP